MMLFKLVALFFFLLICGLFFTLIIFKFNFAVFKKSELSKKIIFWIPIFVVFLFFVFSNHQIQFLIVVLLIGAVLLEYLNAIKKVHSKRLLLFSFIIMIVIGLIHLIFLKNLDQDAKTLLLTIGIGTAVSDVTAFFFGNFRGKHKLPQAINPNKSWEGIIGQILGAFLGVFLIKFFIISRTNIMWFIPIGIGSAIGDIFNSFTKRKANINSWSNIIPGHGGFIDRFSSLAISSLLTFYFALLKF